MKNVKYLLTGFFIIYLSLTVYSQLSEFKIIFSEFTDNIKSEAFKKSFSYNSWKYKFKRTRNPRRLRYLLLDFESGLRNSIKKNEWDRIRFNWLKRLKRAVSVSEIAEALYKLEINIRWEATFPGWQRQRRIWVKRIQSLY